jgi:DNA-binding NarL/FixJ family response regulator
MAIKIFSIDDSDSYLDTIEAQLTKSLNADSFDLVGRYGDVGDDLGVEDLLETLTYLKPDIILMDIGFSLVGRPDDFGIELIRKIKSNDQLFSSKIIVLSDRDNDNKIELNKLKSFMAGAVAYLPKTNASIWSECIIETAKSNAVKSYAEHFISDREKEVLMHLADDCQGIEVCNKMEGISNAGVQYHINNLRAKFEVNTLHGIIGVAFRMKILK